MYYTSLFVIQSIAGKFGVVYKGLYRPNDKETIEVAVKTIKGVYVYHKSFL